MMRIQSYLANYKRIFGASLVNDFRMAYTRTRLTTDDVIPDSLNALEYIKGRGFGILNAGSGITGIAIQDGSLQESMGPIIDRTKENLVGCDNGIIMARHRLMRAVKAMEKGEQPPGIVSEHQRVRSCAVVLPPDKPFKDAARDALVVQNGREHATV